MGKLLQFVLLPLPWAVRRPLLNFLFGWSIASGARVGYSILGAQRVDMAPGSAIGHLTYVKGVRLLQLGPKAILGSLNWVTASPLSDQTFFAHRTQRDPSLRIGAESAITARHLIDCTDSVTVGEFSIVGGWGSQILSHSIDFQAGRQDAEPIHIGDRAFVGTRAILLKGSIVPDCSIVAAGSTYGRRNAKPLGLFAGNPARRIGEVDPEAGYLVRQEGFVH
jgi:hypothetical protein